MTVDIEVPDIDGHVGQGVPLLACAGRYVFPSIRPLLGNFHQDLIVLPFDADEFRRKLDSLDLGF